MIVTQVFSLLIFTCKKVPFQYTLVCLYIDHIIVYTIHSKLLNELIQHFLKMILNNKNKYIFCVIFLTLTYYGHHL